MFRSRIIPATMTALFALGATGSAFASSGEHEHGREAAAILAAKTSIAQAIAVAEQKTGGRAMKVEAEHEKGAYLYAVKTVSAEKVTEVFVDPASGSVVRTDDEGWIARLLDQEDQREFAKLSSTTTTLATAIATAEQNTGGKAIEAGLDDEDGAMAYEIEIDKDGTRQRVLIDSTSGTLLKVSGHESGEHDDD